MIKQLEIVGSLPYFDPFKTDDFLGTLNNLSQINFFIGANNSGKNRMLRGLFLELSKYERYNPNEATGFGDEL